MYELLGTYAIRYDVAHDGGRLEVGELVLPDLLLARDDFYLASLSCLFHFQFVSGKHGLAVPLPAAGVLLLLDAFDAVLFILQYLAEDISGAFGLQPGDFGLGGLGDDETHLAAHLLPETEAPLRVHVLVLALPLLDLG